MIHSTIRTKRNESGFTIEEMAMRCGVSRSTYIRWENGDKHPDAQQLPLLAGAFGCSVGELFGEASQADPMAMLATALDRMARSQEQLADAVREQTERLERRLLRIERHLNPAAVDPGSAAGL